MLERIIRISTRGSYVFANRSTSASAYKDSMTIKASSLANVKFMEHSSCASRMCRTMMQNISWSVGSLNSSRVSSLASAELSRLTQFSFHEFTSVCRYLKKQIDQVLKSRRKSRLSLIEWWVREVLWNSFCWSVDTPRYKLGKVEKVQLGKVQG